MHRLTIILEPRGYFTTTANMVGVTDDEIELVKVGRLAQQRYQSLLMCMDWSLAQLALIQPMGHC